jgi:hypothetical protein
LALRGFVEKLRIERNIAAGARQFCFQLQQLRQTFRRQRIERWGVVGKNGNRAAGRFCENGRVVLNKIIQAAKIGG